MATRARPLSTIAKHGIRMLGTLEARVMQHLWTHGPDSIANTHRALCDSSALAYTTVATELARLVDKRLVGKTGLNFQTRYHALVDRATLVERTVGRVLDGLLATHPTATLHGFVEAIGNDDEALEETLRLIRERRRKRT